VLMSDGISTQHTLCYPSGDRVGPISQNNGHVFINDQNENWQIFVPQDRDAREICYRKKLPSALADWLKIDPSTSESIGHVLNSSFSVIDELLEEEGIGKVSGIEPPPRRVPEELYDDDEVVVRVEEEAASDLSGGAPMLFANVATPSSTPSPEDSARPETPAFIVPRERESFTVDAYARLLDNVVRIARQTILSRHDSLPGIDPGQFHPGFDHNTTFGTRSQGQMNHDFKIGAAGELFVGCLGALFTIQD
jgi:hypothetical protein